jgi:uncharacterized membrane protein YfcA
VDYFVICGAALITAGLTLFSGFGLGTLLMPVFAVFFPIDIAVALTAIVHFLNNLFKLILLGKHADRAVVIRFGIPAIIAAFLGARMLLWLSDLSPLISYQLMGRDFQIITVKLVVAALMVFFALFEIVPRFETLVFEKKYLPLGGLLSGFFGGLTGHQGALRSAFLVRCGLSKEALIATGVTMACLVDITRLSVYGFHLAVAWKGNSLLLIAATISAFLGSFVGKRLIRKATLKSIRVIVSILLFAIAAGLGAGII